MFKKIMKKIKQLSQDGSEHRYGHYYGGSSSSSNRRKRSPMNGSNRYKRKGRSSS